MVGTLWCGHIIEFGNCNETRATNERSSGGIVRSLAREFNSFIDLHSLCELDHTGLQFTFLNNASPPTLSRLDRFLDNKEWVKLFLGMAES